MDEILNELFAIQNRITREIPNEFRRYITINFNHRLIVLTGARGIGKTTFVLQHYLSQYGSVMKCLYFSVDNPLVTKSGIYEIGKKYFSRYGSTIIVDEVHKQANWAIDIKALYDSFPDKKIIILGSSKLNLINQKGDLSRRALIYNLKGLSFREFINLKYGKQLKQVSWESILTNHTNISSNLLSELPEIPKYFHEYKRYGFYPFFDGLSDLEYYSLLHNIIDKIIYEDVPSIKNVRSSSALVMKKLIAYLAMSVIPTVNVSSMCNELDIPKETLYEYLDLLNRADIINIVRRENSTVRSMKHAKILLLNPNLYFAISHELWQHTPEQGNIRESLFVSQLDSHFYSSTIVDFSINIGGKTIEVEIGGKNKSRKQLQNIENSYIFKDDIEIGHENIIPLYLIGFLY